MSERQEDEDGLSGLLDDQAAQATEQRSKKPLRRWLIVLACLVTALLVGAGIAVGAGVNALNSVKREPGLLPTNRNPVDPSTLLNRPMNFLLLGSDSRGQDRGRSDVMMLVHSDPDRAKLYLISLPRDLWVPIPGHGTDKINAAYAYGGAPLAVQTVENLLKVRIDNVALTDFTGFFRLIDDLGGVTVFNEIPSQSLGLSFPRGELTLTGETALVYVRERHDLPRGDFDRAERQRLVVKAIVDKLASRGTFSNPSRLLSVINRLSSTVTVDDSLTNQRIVALAQDLQITSGQDIDQLMVPVAGLGTSAAGASYVKVDRDGMKRLAAALSTGRMATYTPEALPSAVGRQAQAGRGRRAREARPPTRTPPSWHATIARSMCADVAIRPRYAGSRGAATCVRTQPCRTGRGQRTGRR